MTQLISAKNQELTPEMGAVAIKEGIDPEI